MKSIAPGTAIAMLIMQGALFTLAGAGMWLRSGRQLSEFVTFSLTEIAPRIGFGGALILLGAALFHGFPQASDHLVRLQSDTYRFLGPSLGWPAIGLILAGRGHQRRGCTARRIAEPC